MNKKVVLLITLPIVALGLIACCIAGVISAGGTDPKQSEQGLVVPEPTEPSFQSSAPTQKAAAMPKGIGDGQRLVGKDIPAGTYRTPGADDNGVVVACIWSVQQTDDSNSLFLDGGSSDSADAPGRVKLKEGNLFTTAGCKPWVKQ